MLKDKTYNWIYDIFDTDLVEVYVICMDSRIDKVKRFFHSINCNPTYLRAISKYEITKEELIDEGFIMQDCELNMGRICCHYSHIQALKRFLNSGSEYVIIFEDDNRPINRKDYVGVYYIFEYILKHIPKDFELLNLSSCWEDCDLVKEINEHTVLSYRALCRNAYVMSRKGASKVVTHTVPMRKHSGDNMVANIIKNEPFLKAYSSKANLFDQNREVLGSELGNNSKIKRCRGRTKVFKKMI